MILSYEFIIMFLSIFFCGLENLTRVLEGERDSQGAFQALPFHYVEISRLIFDQ